MSVKTAELAETPASADDFHALEEKIIRTIEMLKAARAAQLAPTHGPQHVSSDLCHSILVTPFDHNGHRVCRSAVQM